MFLDIEGATAEVVRDPTNVELLRDEAKQLRRWAAAVGCSKARSAMFAAAEQREIEAKALEGSL